MFFTKKKQEAIEEFIEESEAIVLQRVDALAHAMGLIWNGSGYETRKNAWRTRKQLNARKTGEYSLMKKRAAATTVQSIAVVPMERRKKKGWTDLSGMTPEEKIARKRIQRMQSYHRHRDLNLARNKEYYRKARAQRPGEKSKPSDQMLRDRINSRRSYEKRMAALGRTVKHRTPDPSPASLYGPPAEPTRKAVADPAQKKTRIKKVDLAVLTEEQREARRLAQKALANARYIAKKRSEAGVMLRESLPMEKREPEHSMAVAILDTPVEPKPRKVKSGFHHLPDDFFTRLKAMNVGEVMDATTDVAIAHLTVSKLRGRLHHHRKYGDAIFHDRDYYAFSDMNHVRVKRLA